MRLTLAGRGGVERVREGTIPVVVPAVLEEQHPNASSCPTPPRPYPRVPLGTHAAQGVALCGQRATHHLSKRAGAHEQASAKIKKERENEEKMLDDGRPDKKQILEAPLQVGACCLASAASLFCFLCLHRPLVHSFTPPFVGLLVGSVVCVSLLFCFRFCCRCCSSCC